mgnify:CR=1 FL=1
MKKKNLRINHSYLVEQFSDYSKIFKQIEKVVKKKDARPFKIPKNINLVLVDAETGMKADINTKKVIYESFKTKDNIIVGLKDLSDKNRK